MYTRNRREFAARVAGAAWAALLAATCSSCLPYRGPNAPPGWFGPVLPGGPGAHGYGAWVVIRTGFARDDVFAGELIVCRFDSLWVLTDGGLRSAALKKVRSFRLYKETGGRGRVHEESIAGTREESIVQPREQSRYRAREHELRPWARFPQGWPPGLDPAALRPKPLAAP